MNYEENYCSLSLNLCELHVLLNDHLESLVEVPDFKYRLLQLLELVCRQLPLSVL